MLAKFTDQRMVLFSFFNIIGLRLGLFQSNLTEDFEYL